MFCTYLDEQCSIALEFGNLPLVINQLIEILTGPAVFIIIIINACNPCLGHRLPIRALQPTSWPWTSHSSSPHVQPVLFTLYVHFQVMAQGVSWPPSLPFPLGVPDKALPYDAGCRLAESVTDLSSAFLKDVIFCRLLSHSFL